MQVPHVCVLSIRRFVLWCIMLLQPMAQIGQQALGAGRGILHVYTYLQMVRTYCRTYSSPTEGALPARSCCLFPMLLSFVCRWKRVRDGGGVRQSVSLHFRSLCSDVIASIRHVCCRCSLTLSGCWTPPVRPIPLETSLSMSSSVSWVLQ